MLNDHRMGVDPNIHSAFSRAKQKRRDNEQEQIWCECDSDEAQPIGSNANGDATPAPEMPYDLACKRH